MAGSRAIRASDFNDLRTWLGSAPVPPPPTGGCQEYAPPAGGTPTTLATAFYDEGGAGAFALGRRTRLTDPSGQTAWSFDAGGRVSRQAQTILGTAYSTAYVYDAANRVVRTTYPDGEQVTTAYGAHGLPTALTGTSTYISNATYSPLLQPLGLTYGGGATAALDYYDAPGELDRDGQAQPRDFRLRRLTYAAPGGAMLQRHDLRYDRAGNVTKWWQEDSTATVRAWTYTYDDRDRLTSAQATNPPAGQPSSFAYAYDAIGNLTSGPLGGYSYGDPAHKHAATAAGPNAYSYDANGALLSRTEGGTTYQHGHDLQGRQTSVTVGGVTTTFVYDGDGALAAKQVGGTTVAHYAAGGLFEKDPSTGATRKYYRLGARLVAMRDSATGIHFLHQDHLGSTSLQTGTSGAHEGTQLRGPFGQPWFTSGSLGTDRQYTGQRSLEAAQGPQPGLGSLLHYGARWYSPVLGRFLQPDTIVPNPGNPQDLNRYAYVRNNPLKYADPTGHRPMVDPVELLLGRGGAAAPGTDDPGGPLAEGLGDSIGGASGGAGGWPDGGPTGAAAADRGLDPLGAFLGRVRDAWTCVDCLDLNCVGIGMGPGGTLLPSVVKPDLPGGDDLGRAGTLAADRRMTAGSGGGRPSAISMTDAIEQGLRHLGGAGDDILLETTGSGKNFQFRRTVTDTAGNVEQRIARFDVNPTDRHVQTWGEPHLNLEVQVNGRRISDIHVAIDPLTIRPGDHP